jgi:pimeloyl-ACP methyl ester carboxylesterase
MNDTYVLVHGAWHTGAELEPAAAYLRGLGASVHCPTLAGNRPGDDRSKTGLMDAAQSLVDYLNKHNLNNVRLAGHSYGGMVLAQLMAMAPKRVGRLIFVNAFVPNPGECLNDMVPPMYVGMFDQIAAASNGAVVLPYPVWREAFIGDADAALAKSAYDRLNPQPYKTFTDKLQAQTPLAALEIGKSYINCTMDAALPHSMPWHPRLSEKLGLFRYVECSGSHEVWFTDPSAIAKALLMAGRD